MSVPLQQSSLQSPLDKLNPKDNNKLKRHIDLLNEAYGRVKRLGDDVNQSRVAPMVLGESDRLPLVSKLVSALHHFALSFSVIKDTFLKLSKDGQEILRTMFDDMANTIVEFITTFKQNLKIDNWTVQGTLNFPLGGSFSISVTFEKDSA